MKLGQSAFLVRRACPERRRRAHHERSVRPELVEGLRAGWFAFLFAAVLAAASAAAQDYPTRPIRVIVAQPAGSTPDVTARLVAPALTRLLGQQLVIDNRAGAGGVIGAELVARAVPDGY